MDNKFKIAVSIIAVIFITWLALFAYDRYWKKNNGIFQPANSPGGQLPYNISKDEEKKLKSLAENFVLRYGSYTLGDFSGLEGLKNQMIPELWREKSVWIDAQKQELAGKPRHYITFSAFSQKSKIISYNTSRAEVEVSYLERETKGATIQKETTIYIDEFGQKGKSIPPSLERNKKIRLGLVKEYNEWKVFKIGDAE